jgi:hypothetical protein
MEGDHPPGRRTLLQRALALVAGATGLGLGKQASAATSEALPARGTFTLYAQRSAVPGHGAPDAGRVVSRGELFDGPAGDKLGELQTTCFCLGSTYGPDQFAASNLEFQTFRLPGGTLFGLGVPVDPPDGVKAHAILGGTGRYAGARGAYYERTLASQRGTGELSEFKLTVTG